MSTPNRVNESKTNDEKAEAKSQVETPAVPATKEFIVIDIVLYLTKDVNGKRRSRKYNRGDTVQLEANVAKNLLREPRPSVVEKSEDKEEK